MPSRSSFHGDTAVLVRVQSLTEYEETLSHSECQVQLLH